MIALNSSTPNMPRFETVKVLPVMSSTGQRPVAGGGRERRGPVVELADRQPVGVADDRHDEPGRHGDGEPEVDPPARPDRDAVGARVDVGQLDEALGGGRQHEVGDG